MADGRLLVEGRQEALLERRTGGRIGDAGRPISARPRLVHQLVAEDLGVAREALGHSLQAGDVVVLHADAVGTWTVRPEALERPLHGWVLHVVEREHRVGWVGQTVVDGHPVG